MTLALYADHHVNSAIVEGLRQRGIDVLTVFEDRFDRCSDEEILSRRMLISLNSPTNGSHLESHSPEFCFRTNSR